MTDSEVQAWLSKRSTRLASLEPGAGFADLEGWAQVWSGTTVLGLGESTHGTREFFTLKHRLVEFLVVRMGLRVFAMEASESAASAVDDYVRSGIGDGATALAGLRFWTWNTREMLDLLH